MNDICSNNDYRKNYSAEYYSKNKDKILRRKKERYHDSKILKKTICNMNVKQVEHSMFWNTNLELFNRNLNFKLTSHDVYESSWKRIFSLIKHPYFFMNFLFISGITFVLVVLQNEAYQALGQSMSLPISIICEVGLVMLAAFKFTGWKKLCGVIVALLLFGYNLGLMSFDIVQTEDKKTAEALNENFEVTSLKKELRLAQAAQENAIKKEESGNIKFYSKQIQELRKDIQDQSTVIVSAEKSLVKNWGLVALRAILMLLNALLVHSLTDEIRRKRSGGAWQRAALT